MNESDGLEITEENGEYTEYYTGHEYDYGEYNSRYISPVSNHQPMYTGSLNGGAVYYDQENLMRNFPSGPGNFPQGPGNFPTEHHYMDDYHQQYDPYYSHPQGFYRPPPPHQQYFNAYHPGQYHYRGGRGRGNRGRGNRGGRGRGNRDQYYEYNDSYGVAQYGADGYGHVGGGNHELQQQSQQQRYNSVDGTKPKQFSYQGNRYRHDRDNRRRSTSNNEDNDSQNNGGRNYKSYSLLRSSHKGDTTDNNQDTMYNNENGGKFVEVEDFRKKAFNEKEADEYSYVEKAQENESESNPSTRGGRGYRSQRNGKNREFTSSNMSKPNRNDSGYKYNRRGGYSNPKRNNNSNSVEYSQEIGRDEKVTGQTAGKKSEEVSSLTVLKGRNEKINRNKDSPRSYEAKSKDGDTGKEAGRGKPDIKSKSRSNQSYRGRKFHFKGDQDDETQRGLLIEQLSTNSYECMVCCELVRRDAAIWSCGNCYNVFHLRCIKKWARSPTAAVEGGQTGWRCPACQNVSPQVPNQYRCFCSKVRDPDSNRYDTPHSCGEVCKKKREGECPHLCNILCHPGPCPVCQATISKGCNCKRIKMTVKCGQAPAIQCQEVCGKTLNCGRHECKQICHEGLCKPCDEVKEQVCYCEESKREVICGSSESFSTSFCCGNNCNRKLNCGNHHCSQTCHPGVCDECDLAPDSVKYCPCLKTPLEEITPPGEERKSCLDTIATCDKPCDKELSCGPTDKPHRCQSLCHNGDCPSCEDNSEIICKCGALSKLVPCKELTNYKGDNQFVCDKRCNKKRDCGRHRCSQLCCVDVDHKCDIICGRKLSCNLHRCEELCHRGNCHTCWNVSFDELRCYCGNEVMYPPVACGTKPPECRKTCTRMHECGHEVLHNCHSEEVCPPCTSLTEKWCLGKHERRRNIPCHITDITCGMKCNKMLSCGQHKCQQTCHKGECLAEGEKCEQPCTVLRETCAHLCAAPCHKGEPCPNTQCKAEVTLKCECGSRSEKGVCQVGIEERTSQDYQRLATSMLAMRMSDARDGQSIDISSLMTGKDQSNKPRKLECTSECAIKERNRRLALALEIKNPDVSSKLGSPTYTEFLKEYSKKNASFVSSIEKALSDLVHIAQSSMKKYRSHAFPSMNRDQRRVVHELAEFYGCTTQSYDEEPKKNVVASAYKDKCFKPSVTLTSLVQREMHPKAPVPIPHRSSEEKIRSTVQATKQSTKLLGETTITGSSWNSKTSKPLNSWTTLKSSKSNTNNSSSSSAASNPLRMSQSDTGIAESRSAWGQNSSSQRPIASSSGSNIGGSRTPWGQSSTVGASGMKKEEKKEVKKEEPFIDYFEMTD